jgi:hypothetical protein
MARRLSVAGREELERRREFCGWSCGFVDCLLVAAPAVPDLLLCAKHLSFSANEAAPWRGGPVSYCPSTVCVLLRIGAAPAVGVRPCIWLPTRPRSAHYGWETRVQTASVGRFAPVRVLFLSAKHLFFSAKAWAVACAKPT